MTIAIQLEAMEDAVGELPPLLAAHAAELLGEGAPCTPDLDLLVALDRTGIMSFATARIDGRLVGYCAFLIAPSLRVKGTVAASDAGLYLAPEARRGIAAARLILAAEKGARVKGATQFCINMPVEPDRSRLMLYCGYLPHETVFTKGV